MATKQATRLTGTVAWFNDDKGFGFIKRDGDSASKDVFVHYTGITPVNGAKRRSLEDGDAVEFEIIQGQKGPQAVNVVKLAGSVA